MPTGAVASSATTGAWRFTAWIGCLRSSARNANRSTTCGRTTKSSACARNCRSRCVRSRTSPRWRNSTVFDISKPASNAQEAFQWTYLAYLGAIKEANGAAMSIGRISTFLDIYIERDLKAGILTRRGRRSSGTSWCRSSASSASCARPTTTRCSAATPIGPPSASAAWIWTAVPLVTKSSYRHAAHALQSRPGAGAEHHGALVEATCPRPSSATASRSARTRRRCSTRTTT